MNEVKDIFASARIKWDGAARVDPGEAPFDLFVVETARGRFWFEAYYDFAENRNDFLLTVRNFGLGDRAAAGSTTPLLRRAFSFTEARAAQSRLEAAFLGTSRQSLFAVRAISTGSKQMPGRELSKELDHRQMDQKNADRLVADAAGAGLAPPALRADRSLSHRIHSLFRVGSVLSIWRTGLS